jgi:hypothetical protein
MGAVIANAVIADHRDRQATAISAPVCLPAEAIDAIHFVDYS